MWRSARCTRWSPVPRSCGANCKVDGNRLAGRSAAMNENLTTERRTFVTHLECAMHGDRYEADQLHNLSKAGKPLLVRYDLAAIRKALSKDALARRPQDLWRYREMLPVRRVTDI